MDRKESLAKGVSNDYIDEIYDVAISNGAFGGKLMGAGGGGFFFFIAPPKLHKKIKKVYLKLKFGFHLKLITKELKLFLEWSK